MPETQTPPAADVPVAPPDPGAEATPPPPAEQFQPPKTAEELDRIITSRWAAHQKALTEKVTQDVTARVNAEWETKVQPMASQLQTLTQERENAQRAAMSDAERIQAELADARGETERLKLEVAKREAVNAALVTQQRVAQLTAAAKAVAPGLPVSIYQAQMQEMAAKPDFTLEAGTAAVKQWGDEYRASLEQLGVNLKPPSIGSAGAPPAEPRGDADAELTDLLARAESPDPRVAQEATLALAKRFGT